ncbi:galactose-specific lectin nattectin-like [Entelurus aequoreus]|uniref:galactose-specific lectin nattectin-like n=1 Tax=Entelurus aequoreus TaxID=161455 RepID=UPI002B1D3157|nr:galactose-specific lectin nattectin-like [Entelurus aequoreus]
MAFTSRAFFLLCGIIGLTGVLSLSFQDDTDECCPKGWTQLNKRCFIYQEEQRSFLDAESICNLLGGNLASILSALENAVVLEVIKLTDDPIADTWIGLHQALETENFLWTDGSDFKFDAFNATVNVGDCAEIESSEELWNLDSCTDLHPYVCARDTKCKH